MKKIIICIILVLFSCKEKEIKYYPKKINDIETTKVIFEGNYKKFREKIMKVVDTLPFIELQNNRIYLYAHPYGCIRERNILEISSDSINSAKGTYPIKMLPHILKKHYLNYGKSPFYSDSPNKCATFIHLKDNDTKEIFEKLLKNIIKEFDLLNKNNNLKLYISIKIPIPPPPPYPPPLPDKY